MRTLIYYPVIYTMLKWGRDKSASLKLKGSLTVLFNPSNLCSTTGIMGWKGSWLLEKAEVGHTALNTTPKSQHRNQFSFSSPCMRTSCINLESAIHKQTTEYQLTSFPFHTKLPESVSKSSLVMWARKVYRLGYLFCSCKTLECFLHFAEIVSCG